MAKRKRLAPAQPRDLDTAPNDPGLETKTFTRLSAHPAPPIAHVAGEASTAAALDELSETLRRARVEGRMVIDVPLAQIEEDYLVRDRVVSDGEEMEALQQSLRSRGQQTPIEVVELGPDRYGLISGWRRCRALRQIGAEAVRALVTRPADGPDAYVAMIEENEIRLGLSYFERARIVLKSVEAGVFDSHKAALQTLFSSASRAKRSKIKSFIPVVEALGPSLRFPAQLGERLGLQISKALSEEAGAARRLLAALISAQAEDSGAEQAALAQCLKGNLGSTKPLPSKATIEAVVPGIVLKVNGSGKVLSLHGKGVTAALRDELAAWLKARG